MDKDESSYVTFAFRYWAKPTMRPADNGAEDSRKPEFLKKALVEDIITLVWPSYESEELKVISNLSDLEKDVKDLIIEYSGPDDHLKKVNVVWNEESSEPWREYQVTVTGSMRAIQGAINAIEAAVKTKQLKGYGRALCPKPQEASDVTLTEKVRGYLHRPKPRLA